MPLPSWLRSGEFREFCEDCYFYVYSPTREGRFPINAEGWRKAVGFAKTLPRAVIKFYCHDSEGITMEIRLAGVDTNGELFVRYY